MWRMTISQIIPWAVIVGAISSVPVLNRTNGRAAQEGPVIHRLGGMSVDHFAFSPDGKRLISGAGRTLRIWDLATKKQYLLHAASDVHCVGLSADKKTPAF